MTTEIDVRVDLTNPGQFFACCGLFELAHRMSRGCRAAFIDDKCFRITPAEGSHLPTLEDVIAAFRGAGLLAVEPTNPTKTPLIVPHPFNIYLDWWNDDRTGGSDQRTWAGQQKVVDITSALHATLLDSPVSGETLLTSDFVIYRPGSRTSPIEAFYFDSRRGSQGTALDIGFSPDTQKMRATVSAALELLCVVGLQRFRPATNRHGSKAFCVWQHPLPIIAASAVASCGVLLAGSRTYSFRVLRRSESNAYYLGFSTAIPQGEER